LPVQRAAARPRQAGWCSLFVGRWATHLEAVAKRIVEAAERNETGKHLRFVTSYAATSKLGACGVTVVDVQNDGRRRAERPVVGGFRYREIALRAASVELDPTGIR